MAQISRPFQIAFVAVALLASVWAFTIRGRSSSSSEANSPAATTPAAPVSAPSSAAAPSAAAAEEKAAAGSTHVYTGSAPGVQGLTGAINKAHEAVAKSQVSAATVEGDANRASTPNSSGGTAVPATPAASSTPAATGSSTAATSTSTHAPAATTTTATHTAAAAPVAVRSHKHAGAATHVAAKTLAPTVHHRGLSAKQLALLPAGQRAIETELEKGDIVVLLFWNPAAADDQLVGRELRVLENLHQGRSPKGSRAEAAALRAQFGRGLRAPIAVHLALPSQVSLYGSITHGIQVDGTPTTLVIGAKARTITLTGLQDAFGIQQTIEEARAA